MMKVNGSDGAVSGAIEFDKITKTNAQGHPILMSATSRCGTCGTSDQHSGKPGSTMKKFTCRSCRTVNLCNGGVPFRYWSVN